MGISVAEVPRKQQSLAEVPSDGGVLDWAEYRQQAKDPHPQPQPLQRRTCLAGLQSKGEGEVRVRCELLGRAYRSVPAASHFLREAQEPCHTAG